MCGIVGSVGQKLTRSFIIDGLKTLEYRGYDSAGAAFLKPTGVQLYKLPGRIADLEKIVPEKESSHVALGHTRWATHGAPNFENAHPHLSNQKLFTVVHNGVIDNFRTLHNGLERKGFKFYSETDTEVIANILEDEYFKLKSPLKAIEAMMNLVEGSYALGIIFSEEKDRLYFAKNHSPLVVGRGSQSNYIASDYLPMLSYAKDYVVLTDLQYGYMTAKQVVVMNLSKEKPVPLNFHTTDITAQDIGRNGYPHYMLKEIEEQPEVVRRIIDNYYDGETFKFDPALIARFHDCDQIIFLASGTSYHASLIGRRYFESIGIPTRVYIASEWAYYPEIKGKKPIFIFVSQSGETADLIRCVDVLKDRGSTIVTITNTKGSTLDRAAHYTLLIYAGVEIAVASTKAYTAQVALLAMLISALRNNNGILEDLNDVIHAQKSLIAKKSSIEAIAKDIHKLDDVFFIGRGYDYDVALEASLKLKEISYIHSEGLPGGELKHGPIALINRGTPIFAFISDPHTSPAIRSNLQEVLARGAKVISVSNEGISKPEDTFVTSNTKIYVSPLVKVMFAQYLAYYTALELKRDIDKPRNLAKSVTVE